MADNQEGRKSIRMPPLSLLKNLQTKESFESATASWGLNYFLDEWCGKKTGRLRETWHFIKPTAALCTLLTILPWATSSSWCLTGSGLIWKINTSQYYISVQLLLLSEPSFNKHLLNTWFVLDAGNSILNKSQSLPSQLFSSFIYIQKGRQE